MNTSRIKCIFIFIFALLIMTGCASDQEKTQKFLAESQAYFDSGEYNKADIQIKNALQLSPDSVAAYELLTKIQLKLGKGREAFNALMKIEQLAPDNLKNKIQVASFFLLGKNIEEAEKRVVQVLEKEPENIDALYLQGGILTHKKEPLDKIEENYLKILKIDGNQAKALLLLARLYNFQGKFTEAEDSLKNAIQIQPENKDTYKALYGFYISRKQLTEAETVLNDLIKKNPNEADPLILLSSFQMAQGKYLEAENLLLKALEVEPKNINTHMVLARLLLQQQRPDDAEKYFKAALDIEPENFAVKNTYAEFYFSRQDTEKAMAIVDEILTKRPNYMPSSILKGKIYVAKNEHQKAVDLFQSLLKEEPDSANLNFLLGSTLFEMNDFNQSKTYLLKALEKDPGISQARLMIADIQYKQGNLDLAEQNIKKVLTQFPDNYNANIISGNITMANRQFDAAKTIFSDMIRQHPEIPTAYFRLGVINHILKENAKAIENFNAALKLNQNLMDVFTNLISVYVSEKKYDQAINLCDTHMEKVKESPVIESVILNIKGSLLLDTQKTDQGKALLKEAIEKNPSFITPYMTLASVLTREDNIDGAINVYNALIEKRPDQPSPHTLIATLYEKQNKKDEAEAHYNKALEIQPDYLPAMNNLAYLYADQSKNLNKALDLARLAKEKASNSTAIIDTLGWVYLKKELYSNAADEFKTCVEKEPENPIFHYHLGLAYHKQGKMKEAKESLQKSFEISKNYNGADEARTLLNQL